VLLGAVGVVPIDTILVDRDMVSRSDLCCFNAVHIGCHCGKAAPRLGIATSNAALYAIDLKGSMTA